eukprot:6210838-Pleurochrysis_carterae.AAC.1
MVSILLASFAHAWSRSGALNSEHRNSMSLQTHSVQISGLDSPDLPKSLDCHAAASLLPSAIRERACCLSRNVCLRFFESASSQAVSGV